MTEARKQDTSYKDKTKAQKTEICLQYKEQDPITQIE